LAGARSAKAARETADLIENSNKQIEEGSKIATQTAEALDTITEHVGAATKLVGDIACASKEQAQGVGQVNQGLSQIDQVTQQISAGAEETASASEQMRQQSEMLQKLVARFNLKQRAKSTDTFTATSPAMSEQHVLKQAETLVQEMSQMSRF